MLPVAIISNAESTLDYVYNKMLMGKNFKDAYHLLVQQVLEVQGDPVVHLFHPFLTENKTRRLLVLYHI